MLPCFFQGFLSEKPSLELCKSLIMLRDFNISGRINLLEIPVLLQTLFYWRVRSKTLISFRFGMNLERGFIVSETGRVCRIRVNFMEPLSR